VSKYIHVLALAKPDTHVWTLTSAHTCVASAHICERPLVIVWREREREEERGREGERERELEGEGEGEGEREEEREREGERK